MDETDLAGIFETHRPRLRAVALRVLGTPAEADDAVQETWLRLARSDADAVDNLGGWLTTVTGRVALSMLRSRSTRREDPMPEGVDPDDASPGPETQAALADAVGPALLVVLDTLSPAERLAFVLHDLFAVPFEEIAPIVDRSPAATRQLASRARRRVRGGEPDAGPGAAPDAAPDAAADLARRRAVVDAFLTAAREGDFAGLLAVLDPDVRLRADDTALAYAADARARGIAGAPDFDATTRGADARGADAVARVFAGRAKLATPAVLDGLPGAVYAPGGVVRSAFRLTIVDGRITGIEVVADPDRLAVMTVEP